MKKLLSMITGLSVITGVAPMCAGAVSEPIYIEDGAESKSGTIICGDVNNDGSLNIADAVILQRCLMNNYSHEGDSEFDESRLDVNFDGVFDVFDLVQMRQTVLHPETAPRQEWSIDVFDMDKLKDDDVSINETADVITTYEEYRNLIEFFNNIKEKWDNNLNELLEKHNKYDEQFFEENNLIVMPFIQDRGNGVFYEVVGTARANYADDDKSFSGIVLGINPSYKEEVGLYPATDTPMLLQLTVPKYQCVDGDEAGYLDISKFFAPDISSCSYTFPDISSCSYTSPYSETEIYIIQKSFLLAGNIDLYLKNPDGSFTYLTYLATDDGCQPFSNNGEWSVDDDGNKVFGDGERYSITWHQDGVTLDHLIDNAWEKVFVSFDGETIQRESYER